MAGQQEQDRAAAAARRLALLARDDACTSVTSHKWRQAQEERRALKLQYLAGQRAGSDDPEAAG